MTVFLYAFRERELILDLFEDYCGARLTYNSMTSQNSRTLPTQPLGMSSGSPPIRMEL